MGILSNPLIVANYKIPSRTAVADRRRRRLEHMIRHNLDYRVKESVTNSIPRFACAHFVVCLAIPRAPPLGGKLRHVVCHRHDFLRLACC